MRKNEQFTVRLRALRREKNMTQLQLAEMLKVSRSTVANWETGLRFPDSEEIESLSRLFGVPADYLYGRTNHRYKVDTRDYFEIDMNKLNSEGIRILKELYDMIINSKQYTRQ